MKYIKDLESRIDRYNFMGVCKVEHKHIHETVMMLGFLLLFLCKEISNTDIMVSERLR